ncbi:MAG: hypothetical protein GY754_34135 [bacterium]|nr:hypothetical protein [bacterium]
MRKYIFLLLFCALLVSFSAEFAGAQPADSEKIDLKLKGDSESTNSLNYRSTASGSFLINLDSIVSYLQMIDFLGDAAGFKVGIYKTPELGFYYFVIDGLAVGSSIYYLTQETKSGAAVTMEHGWGFNPGLSYYFDFGDNFHLFTGAGLIYEMKAEDDSDEVVNILGVNIYFGLNYMLIKHLGIFTEFSYLMKQYDLKNEDSIVHSTLISFGLKFFI